MSLTLDPRQRAMLEAMHIKVWQPKTGVSASETSITTKNIATSGHGVGAGVNFSSRKTAPQPAPAVPAVPQGETRGMAPSASSAPHVTPTPPVVAPASVATAGLYLQSARLLYAGVDPAQTPAARGAGWLVISESDTTAVGSTGKVLHDPFAGDAGRLLDNMLRAMQLHRHPRVHHMALARSAMGDAPPGPDVHGTLAEAIATLRPSMVLVMGRLAAQTLLQRRDPLGQLRGQVHSLHGVPVVVTFDAPYLLRAQADKARAWADLCLALAAVAAGTEVEPTGS